MISYHKYRNNYSLEDIGLKQLSIRISNAIEVSSDNKQFIIINYYKW